MVHSNLGWVGFTCALPAYWHGAAAKMCKTEHTKSTNVHTCKHTTSCAKPSRQDDPASTPLHAHLTFVSLPFFPCFPNTHWDVHICSYLGLWKGSPPCPEAPTVNLRFCNKRAKMRAFLTGCDNGLEWYWLLGPNLF